MDSSCFRKRASHLTCHEVKSWKQGRFVSPSRFLHSNGHVLHAASWGEREGGLNQSHSAAACYLTSSS